MKQKKSPPNTPPAHPIIQVLIQAWRRALDVSGPPDRLQTREFRTVVGHLKTLLSMSDTAGRSLLGTDYFKEPELLGTYLLYQWFVHYQEGLSVLGELPHRPRRVLDICSGPAPFACAALTRGFGETIAVDQNLEALRLGAEVCGRLGHALTIRRWNCLKEELPVEGKFDLIIAGHCLLELFPQESKKEALHGFTDKLLKRLTPQGFLVIVDSSLPQQNRRILELRDAFTAKGIAVQAPCVWKGPCPVASLPNSPCYAQRPFDKPFFIAELQRAAQINLSSLKMTYLILRSPEANWPETQEENLYRVISPPVESHHGKRFYLCGTGGKKSLGSRFEVQAKPARAFDYIKRGELISVGGALEGATSLDIIEGTSVTIKAACGKPLEEEPIIPSADY